MPYRHPYRGQGGWAHLDPWACHHHLFSFYRDYRLTFRDNFIPVMGIPQEATEVIDFADFFRQSRGYSLVVPPKGEVRVDLHHENRGWFHLWFVGKWGRPEAGMLQNLLHRASPYATYTNPTDEARRIYLIVSDPGDMSAMGWPYRLTIRKSWTGPVQLPKQVPVEGIWVDADDPRAEQGSPAQTVPARPAQ